MLQVTLQMLFSCSVLTSCMRLSEHPREDINAAAKAAIKHWRSQVLPSLNGLSILPQHLSIHRFILQIYRHNTLQMRHLLQQQACC